MFEDPKDIRLYGVNRTLWRNLRQFSLLFSDSDK